MVVGGLGLGFTARQVLTDQRVEKLRGRRDRGGAGRLDARRHRPARPGVPGRRAARRGDRRRRGRRWPRPAPSTYDLVLLDVDNGPGFLVHDDNAALYREPLPAHRRGGPPARRCGRGVVRGRVARAPRGDGPRSSATRRRSRSTCACRAATSSTGSTWPVAEPSRTGSWAPGSVEDMDDFRIEHDSMGEVRGPRATRCGGPRPSAPSRTSRSAAPPSRPSTSRRSAQVKAAAAKVNAELGVISRRAGDGDPRRPPPRSWRASTTTHFPIDVFQTGSGTSLEHEHERGARLARAARRGRGAPQRPRQRQPVEQRHVPDLDPRRRDARRRAATWCRRSTHLAAALEAQGRRVRRRREVRPHPPDGRDPGDAGPGARRVRRRGRATASSGSSRRCRGSPSSRSAARRSAPASTPRRASPPR